jgi:hypothetical protein
MASNLDIERVLARMGRNLNLQGFQAFLGYQPLSFATRRFQPLRG